MGILGGRGSVLSRLGNQLGYPIGGVNRRMLPQETTHASLLLRLHHGADSAAWDEFHQRYGDLIRAFARRRGLQPADCDDVLQDVLLSLSKALPNFEYDPAKGRFRSYLKTATLRAIFRKNHQKHGEVALDPHDDAIPPAEDDGEIQLAWEQEWQRYHLRQAMRTLEPEFNEADRAMFWLYAVDGCSAQETAERLEVSVNQVYQAKSRILRRLEEVVARQVEEEG